MSPTCANAMSCTAAEVQAMIADAAASRQLVAHAAAAPSTDDATNVMYFIMCGVLVFFMQAGFAMLEAGSVRSQSIKSILIKNLLDPCFAALGFWIFGYAFAYGASDDPNGFIGDKLFALKDYEKDSGYEGWFFQYAFAATAATILSGAVAERIQIQAFFVYTLWLTCFVYPVVVHWCWDANGWMAAFGQGKNAIGDLGVIDFAGSGVVHMTGGLAGLIGAKMVGPRAGDWKTYSSHNSPLVCLGTFVLWVGWYGFNCGSTLGINGGNLSQVAAKTAVTTTLAAGTSGIVCCFLWNYRGEQWSIDRTANGILAGLVSITAGCSVVDPGYAVLIGFIGALVYSWSSHFVKETLNIDDVIDASPVHFFCGAWGVLAAALFATNDNLAYAYTAEHVKASTGKMFGYAVLFVVAITAWVFVTMTPFFYVMNAKGMLRVSDEIQNKGVDDAEYGGSGYKFDKASSFVAKDGDDDKPVNAGEVESQLGSLEANSESTA